MAERTNKKEKTGNLILSKIIGERPKKPASYDIRRLQKNNKKYQDFCDDYDRRLKEWEDKAQKIRQSQLKDYPEFKEKEKPLFNLPSEVIIDDFKVNFKKINNKDFQERNKYSDSDEPLVFLKTLVYYFNRDQRFFKSPLLRADLSEPSFDKGTCTIGMYGGGKTTTYTTLIKLFNFYISKFENMDISNKQELIDKFTIKKCVAKDVVLRYKEALSRHSLISDVVLPLKTVHDLYIDDLLKEEILFKSRDNEVNIFKDYLTLRDERNRKTHISINYKELVDDNGESYFLNTEKSLNQFRDKYNGTVKDRIYGSYNIIELKGKSLRR